MTATTTHTLAVLVENEPGVLARIASLFARRGFNIESLAVGATEDPSVARITLVVVLGDRPLEQIVKQLHKLIDVLRVREVPPSDAIEKELALIKVETRPGRRGEVLELAQVFHAEIVDAGPDHVVVHASATPENIERLRQVLEPFGITEMARTGRVALRRGAAGLKAPPLRTLSIADRPAS